uniref:Uncharacterized protein n=1 Tax=Timema genevievae TaxID=629358 RepID=A0A7R9PRA8_TIMGE|nr:unnamed protein product [Timema genevievae]
MHQQRKKLHCDGISLCDIEGATEDSRSLTPCHHGNNQRGKEGKFRSYPGNSYKLSGLALQEYNYGADVSSGPLEINFVRGYSSDEQESPSRSLFYRKLPVINFFADGSEIVQLTTSKSLLHNNPGTLKNNKNNSTTVFRTLELVRRGECQSDADTMTSRGHQPDSAKLRRLEQGATEPVLLDVDVLPIASPARNHQEFLITFGSENGLTRATRE